MLLYIRSHLEKAAIALRLYRARGAQAVRSRHALPCCRLAAVHVSAAALAPHLRGTPVAWMDRMQNKNVRRRRGPSPTVRSRHRAPPPVIV